MKFYMTADISEELTPKSAVFTSIHLAARDYLAAEEYGPGIRALYVGIVCINPIFDQFYHERSAYRRSKGELEFEMKFDFETLRDATEGEARAMVLRRLIEGLLSQVMNRRIGHFDYKRITDDLLGLSLRQGWLTTEDATTIVQTQSSPGMPLDGSTHVIEASPSEPSVTGAPTTESLLPREAQGAEGNWTFPESLKLPEDQFWALIAQDQPYEVECQGRMDRLVAALAQLSDHELRGFECTFRELVMRLYRYDILAVAKIVMNSVTDDSWLYFRCALIAAGREVYERAFNDPDSLVEVDLIDSCEALMSVADLAWERKHGDSSGEESPRSFAAQYVSYDLVFEDPAGEDWTEDDLPRLLPRLWAKYGWGE